MLVLFVIVIILVFFIRTWREPSAERQGNMIMYAYVLAIVFVLIGCPVVFWLSILRFGLSNTFHENPVLTIVGILETILGFVLIVFKAINSYKLTRNKEE